MLDATLRPLIDRPLNWAAEKIDLPWISPNSITWLGFAVGFAACIGIIVESYLVALAFLIVNRLCDGLDGALARRRGATDLGGYLDIVLDFIFYSAFPFAFVIASPETNGLTGAFLIFSFIGTGGSFLAFAVFAAKRNISTDIRGRKSFYFLGGLTEGTETIAVFAALCLFPTYFPQLAVVFGVLCWVTVATRIAVAYQVLKED
ncbi:MAG: CDP-alcohol phosphatidyltransferase family protein [Alphaproteobacteria bacterium]|nr:CDP-alcohol phosphatidyltransferase family protein [Alphaproteobacteria bacterium]